MDTLINRIPGSRLLILNLPGSASEPCLLNLISKDTHNEIYISGVVIRFATFFVVSSVSLSLSHWYPGSGVVLDCIDS